MAVTNNHCPLLMPEVHNTKKHKNLRLIRQKDISQNLDQETFDNVISRWQVHAEDTTSCGIKIGVYTEKISQLEDEMKRLKVSDPIKKVLRGKLIQSVGERRRLLNYLKETDYSRYTQANNRLSA